jgi:hypothetical protein
MKSWNMAKYLSACVDSRLIVLCFLSLGGVLVAHDQQTTGSISGTVKDDQGASEGQTILNYSEAYMRLMRSMLAILCGHTRSCILSISALMIPIGSTLLVPMRTFAQQADQGAITGTVVDPGGSVVANVTVTITQVDTAFTVIEKTNESGVYVAAPLNIGQYSVTCAAPGFKTVTQVGLMLNVNSRLGVNCHLEVGQVTQSVTVQASDQSLLQTDESSTGQVFSSKTINETPLNQRNYVFIAQLAAGVAQTPPNVSRGQGNGDFDANGQRPDQNNFILDGVDNNSSAIDFLNGASYVIRPPPDALAEFKVQTSDYSAELGHSAGAVLNASLKSGTNAFHGDVWEYLRNDVLDARSFMAAPGPIPEYRQNQFGATIGGPIVRNHLFFFGDFEANRIIIGNTGLYSVPTPLMRQGNLTELLSPALTGQPQATLLYQPGSGGTQLLTCNGLQNVYCTSQLNTLAVKLLNLLPQPNVNNGRTYNNFSTNLNEINNVAQWDGRLDWNATAKDQAFARLSVSNNPFNVPVPFGPLDGGGYGSDGSNRLKSENLELSETHVFSPRLSNELRFSFEYGAYLYDDVFLNTDQAANLGLGGIPYTPGNGGLPGFQVSGISSFGTPCCLPTSEHANNSELVDDVTKVVGNHALKMGFQLQKIRSSFYQLGFPHGYPGYTGLFTSQPGVAFTGSGIADFLADYQDSNDLSIADEVDQYRWYRAGYFQDDWKVTPQLTLNLGLRYDYFQSYSEAKGRQANFVVTSAALGTGSAQYQYPRGAADTNFGASFLSIAAKDNVSIVQSGNPALATPQKLNFAPRIGFAYSVRQKMVVRGGYGIFYGGLQNGFGNNIAMSYPWALQSGFVSPTCTLGQPCQTDKLNLETGFTEQLANGPQNIPVTLPGVNTLQQNIQTPYTQSFNLSFQQAFSSSLTATVGYVGTTARHIQYNAVQHNTSYALATPGTNTQPLQPFPDFGAVRGIGFIGSSNYNSFQATLEKRYSRGLYFVAAYTWSHSLDDDQSFYTGSTPQNLALLPLSNEYGSSDWDVRNRFTLNFNYQLPVGDGQRFVNRRGILNQVVGGWRLGGTFITQTGSPFTVTPNIPTAAGGNAVALLTGNPYKGGGSPNATNPNVTCPAKVKTIQNWFNPCAFSNPLPGADIAPGQLVTAPNLVVQYLGRGKNQVYGPGFNQLNTSLFKHFPTYEGQYLEFRADIFNTYNTPVLGLPSGSINSNGGLISSASSLGANSPNGRYIQLALKYIF